MNGLGSSVSQGITTGDWKGSFRTGMTGAVSGYIGGLIGGGISDSPGVTNNAYTTTLINNYTTFITGKFLGSDEKFDMNRIGEVDTINLVVQDMYQNYNRSKAVDKILKINPDITREEAEAVYEYDQKVKADAAEKQAKKDPFSDLDAALSGIFTSLGRGLGQTMADIGSAIKDGAIEAWSGIKTGVAAAWDESKRFGQKIVNFGENIIEGDGLYWEDNSHRTLRHIRESEAQNVDLSDAYGESAQLASYREQDQIFDENGMKYLTDYDDYNQKKALPWNEGVGNEIENVFTQIKSNPDSMKFNEEYQALLDDYEKHPENFKDEEGIEERINDIKNKKKNFEKVKQYIISSDIKDITYETKKLICNVYTAWAGGVANNKENRDFETFLYDEYSKGNIGRTKDNKTNAYWGSGGNDWNADYGFGQTYVPGENTKGAEELKTNPYGFTDKEIEKYGKDKKFVRFFKTTISDTDGLNKDGTHWSIGYKDSTTGAWIDMDHSNDASRGRKINWKKVRKAQFF